MTPCYILFKIAKSDLFYIKTSFMQYITFTDICSQLFSTNCLHWSFQTSDILGAEKNHALIKEGLNRPKANKKLIEASMPLVLHNPVQYLFLSMIEGGKILFWEEPEISFVVYPDLIDKIYNSLWLRYSLRFVIALFSLAALITGICYLWRIKKTLINPSSDPQSNIQQATLLFICVIILAFSLIHSIFFILPRYALVIAPLFISLIAWAINYFFNQSLRIKQ